MTESPTRRRGRGHRPGDVVYDDRGEALELQTQIGIGGQGTVWSLTEGQAAVKFIKPDAKVDDRQLRAKLAAVRRYDLGDVHKGPCETDGGRQYSATADQMQTYV